jgi:hypothetical protein
MVFVLELFRQYGICFRIVQTVWHFFVFHFINHDHGQYNYRVRQSLLAKNVEYVAERSLFTEHKAHNWYLEHIKLIFLFSSRAYKHKFNILSHILRLIERHLHKAKHNTTQKNTTMSNIDPTKTRGWTQVSWGVSNPCFINYSYQGIMTEYGWKWHDNGIEINKKNLATNNTHSHQNRRERSLRS